LLLCSEIKIEVDGDHCSDLLHQPKIADVKWENLTLPRGRRWCEWPQKIDGQGLLAMAHPAPHHRHGGGGGVSLPSLVHALASGQGQQERLRSVSSISVVCLPLDLSIQLARVDMSVVVDLLAALQLP
jgi:hypothetical protein